MYMLVEKRTNSHLHLKRSPGIRSWSLCVGIASIGLAAAYYSADSLAWKLFYMAGCFFVAAQNLEQWEEAVFDKNKGTVCLKTFNLYKKILTLSKGGNEQVVAVLSEIRDVNVEEEAVRYFGKGYLVVLRFVTGFSHPLTQSAVLGCRRCTGDLGKLERVSDVEAVAKLITSFLELDRVETPQDFSQSSETEASDADEPQVKY
ncbi:cytochrome b-245 chaperone 1 isoform X1 [Haemorhous mexicanus]|uniref:cytochrome b-245 chaperone 1 isoform X1 n=1 Tax=Haemorhous mexicanus TaxID=30427 RepID=UPI0028BF2DD3|nr:cytochrome b-245 chaperone 1 isoform X1 [Haemorhous mexicanus]XP_059720534.1 cytochrome b-245 chaperone 1 isoform X1 [Haemorhous mexicanus]